MELLLAIGFIGGLFLLTVLFGAPYVPTHAARIDDAFSLLAVPKGKVLLELGAGDGRILAAAGKRGIRAIGYEINPILWIIAWLRIRPYKKLVALRYSDYKRSRWPSDTAAIYIFGTDRDLHVIRKKIASLKGPIQVVSYGFRFNGDQPIAEMNGHISYKL